MVKGTSHPEQFTRYAPVYKMLLDAGTPIMGLGKGKKLPWHLTAPQSRLSDLYLIEAALDWAGLNLGGITHQLDMPDANPHGIANLDIDADGHGLDLSMFSLMVRRTGEASRAQYWFRVADPARQLVFSPHGTHDVCTWNFVLPGSIHKSGSLYELWIKEDGEWVLWDGQALDLSMLPILDPDQFRVTHSPSPRDDEKPPSDKPPRRLVTLKSSRRRREAPTVVVKATGLFPTRIKKAKFYLRHKAWRSISGMQGHTALMVVAANMRLYFDLPKEIGLSLLKDLFNPRCTDIQGNPAPWSDTELEHKWKEAGKPGIYSTLGASDPKAVAKKRSIDLTAEVRAFLAAFTIQEGICNPTILREGFLVWRGGEEVTQTAFGIAVSKATGIKSSCPGGVRIYKGFSLSSGGLRLITHGLPSHRSAA